MHKIALIAVGKLKESHWKEAQLLYIKRLAPYAKITVTEVDASPITDTVGPERSMSVEGGRLASAIPKDAFVVALDRTGKRMSSESLAELLSREGGSGRCIAFLVGGAAGLSAEAVKPASVRLSLSDLTFTHEMARVILLEQLYRAMAIIAGKKYHY